MVVVHEFGHNVNVEFGLGKCSAAKQLQKKGYTKSEHKMEKGEL